MERTLSNSRSTPLIQALSCGPRGRAKGVDEPQIESGMMGESLFGRLLVQLCRAELAEGLKQTVTGWSSVGRYDGEHRLRNQPEEVVFRAKERPALRQTRAASRLKLPGNTDNRQKRSFSLSFKRL